MSYNAEEERRTRMRACRHFGNKIFPIRQRHAHKADIAPHVCVKTNIDYVISAARYRRKKKRTAKIVDSVKQHRLYGNSIVGQGEEASRQHVISNVDVGMIYYTVIFSKDGRFALKNKITKYSFPSGDYIRTDGNKTKGDNLGDLPTF